MTDNPATTTSQKTHRGTPFPAWRLPSGIKNAEDDELERSEGSFERWAIGGGLIVIFGLLVEVAIAAVQPLPTSSAGRLGPLVADTLVAVGVVSEVLFAMLGARVGAELRRRSNARLATANERAANAELETERLRASMAWRSLPADNAAILTSDLRRFPAAAIIEHVADDPESSQLVDQYEDAFRLAGWRVQRRSCSYPGRTTFGILVGVGAPTPEEKAATTVVFDAFVNAALPFAPASAMPQAIMTTAPAGEFPATGAVARIYIGPKQSPK